MAWGEHTELEQPSLGFFFRVGDMSRRLLPWLRPLLALLTVLASFAFQVRGEALGALGGVRTTASAAASREAPTHGEDSAAPMSHAGHTSHSPRPTSGEPDPHQGHGAHCPFCLSNAFALEAGVIGLPQGPPDFLPQPTPGAGVCVVAAVRHADARAPPSV